MRRSVVLVFVVLMMCLPGRSMAQGCAVCTKTASELNPKSARGLNGGILYLAFLPLAILGTVGFLWWRNSREI